MIKDETKTKNAGSDKAEKIDQLIKNYSVCLQEKRTLMKQNVGFRLKDIQDRKFMMRSAIISKALPDLFVKELRAELVEKYFVIHEIVEQINLVIELLRDNYLIVPIIIEESIEFVYFIKDVISLP